ncbi:putative UPF0481 protein At3g02645 [Tripterygium wilfordii]|uniref:putative UPF0481 protein At3g02645 n=1 Tax=Tripterygium wilfordii TaxID=458696 RepID=UPI0018F83487|nr:putative UPF0481 protein At3g02645 [Tripterygium wilfordii]
MTDKANPCIITMSSYPSNPMSEEQQWVVNIRRSLEEEEEIGPELEIPASIFHVPKLLMSTDPNSYIPHIVSIGPYHHWRPQLYEMERYKVSAAKMIQKRLPQSIRFHHVVDQLIQLELKVRASYHKYLHFSDETLAWMMAVDGSFLLEILQVYGNKEGKVFDRIPSRISHLVDNAGRRTSAHNAILRDLVMLENQIPLLVPRKILEVQFPSIKLADQMLHPRLVGLCKELSPVKITEEMPTIDISETAHLLDYLYHMIVPKLTEALPSEVTDEVVGREEETEAVKDKEASYSYSSYVIQVLNETWKLLQNLDKGLSRPLSVAFKFPWTILCSILRGPILHMSGSSQDKEESKLENTSSDSDIEKPPLMEEIAVPSVSKLSKSGVRFLPTNGNILNISFDVKTVTFYLPVVTLDVNTEVVLRNLVAYEASSASGPLVFTRYTELMNGIIDSEEDVKLLREKGIILNHLKSDEEAADLWNGMSKSIRLTKVPFLDKVIEDVNKYYNGRWNVKAKGMMKQCVYGSWPILTFFSTICLLILMGLQAFCSAYSCHHIKITSSDSI